jgi:CBS domain-containing protein
VKPAAAVVSRGTPLAKMIEQLPTRPLERVYVTDGGDLTAWVDPRQLLERLQKGELSGDTPVGAVANPVTLVLTPDMTLCAALDGFLRERATVLPVTTGQWRGALIGEVARHDVLLAIQDRLTFPK